MKETCETTIPLLQEMLDHQDDAERMNRLFVAVDRARSRVGSDPDTFERATVMRALRRALPATSLPSRLVALAEIPRTGSGKAIRQELLGLDRRPR